jgi:hypothetical protein
MFIHLCHDLVSQRGIALPVPYIERLTLQRQLNRLRSCLFARHRQASVSEHFSVRWLALGFVLCLVVHVALVG